MKIDPIFYAIFYDVSKSRTIENAMNKRIKKSQYHNLTDGMGTKEVELLAAGGTPANYRILQVSTFHISNTVDNHLFVICDCEKIKT